MRHKALVLDCNERLAQIGRNLVIGCPKTVFRTVNALIFQLYRRARAIGAVSKFIVIDFCCLLTLARNKQGFVNGRIDIIADIDGEHAGYNNTGDKTHQHQRHQRAENIAKYAPGAPRGMFCALFLLFEAVNPYRTLHVCVFHTAPLMNCSLLQPNRLFTVANTNYTLIIL